jgi:predicted KAP-like P-loop ATPase
MDNKLTFQNEYGDKCDDLLNSMEYIEEFHSIVTNSNYSVYAICGDWGTGKTCFVKMWENMLKDKKMAFVHIDAFKMDYETEPFLMFIKAFKEFMKEKNTDDAQQKEWLNKVKECFSIEKIVKLGINILVEKTIGLEPVKEFVNSTCDTIFDKMSDKESLYDQLVSSLTEITSHFDAPVYIIIDELDRCRPDFSLETLERIKHLFCVENVKFILVYNETLLMSMINNRYGSTIDAKRYLTKFIEKQYLFDNTKYLRLWFMNEIDNSRRRFSNLFMKGFLDGNYEVILKIKKAFNLSLRDIQQLLNNLEKYKEIKNVYDYNII